MDMLLTLPALPLAIQPLIDHGIIPSNEVRGQQPCMDSSRHHHIPQMLLPMPLLAIDMIMAKNGALNVPLYHHNPRLLCRRSCFPFNPIFDVQYGTADQNHHRFLTSVAHPSIPSPLLMCGIDTDTTSIPFVPSKNLPLLIPPAFALSAGSSANIGSKNSPILFASSTLK